MSTFIPQSVTPNNPPSYSTANGTFFTYTMAGLLDGQVETHVEIGTKDNKKVPYLGEQITCLVQGRSGTSVKIKRDIAAAPYVGTAPSMSPVGAILPVAPQMPVSAAPMPSSPPSAPPEDPRQSSIERQNSLTNAISFCSAKKDLYLSLKRPDEAEKQLTGKHIVEVATYFHRYTAGKIIVSMDIEEVASKLGYEKPEAPIATTATEVFQRQVEEEIDMSEVPF